MATFAERAAALDLTTALALVKVDDQVQVNRAYVEDGDYWQGSTAWVGPPVPVNIKDAAGVLDNVQRDFTPLPLIEEVVGCHVTGVVGKEPSFEVVLGRELAEDEEATPQEVADMADANALLTRWWDGKCIHDLLQQIVSRSLYSARCPAHLFVPRDRVENAEDGGTVKIPTGDLAAAIDAIWMDVPLPEHAGLYRDRLSMRHIGVFVSKVISDPLAPISESNQAKEWLEVTFIDDAGHTVLQIREQRDTATVQPAGAETTQPDNMAQIGELTFDCDGNLLVYDMVRPLLITGPVRRMQNTINMIVSMLPRNAKYAGHRERNFFNVEPLGDKDGEVNTQEPLRFGAGIANQWQSTQYTDQDGKTQIAPADLVYGEPVDSAPLRGDVQFLVMELLRACSQLHVVISGDATASAVSRIQARAEFVASLLATKPKVEGLLRWLLKTVLLLACHLAGDTATLDRFKALRIRADVRLDPGPLTPDERRVVIEQYQAGLLSTETAMVMLQVEDIEAEINKMQTQPLSLKDQTQKATAWLAAMVPNEVVWKEVFGFTDEDVTDARGDGFAAAVKGASGES